ncbi:mechanosensitive ion channel family protein [Actinomycetospora sp. CA-101289]|uniref:mechanosensitive ion channel family protein n=1 Tax=Actinomycetospora sp. CA-101289 TaxID=3239893 RepID=UPI003D98F4C0
MTPAPPDGGGGFNILQSLQNAFTTFLSYVPNVIGALLVLLIGFIIARLIRAGISGLLRKARVDEKLTHGKGGEYVARFSPQGKPSQLVGLVVQYVLMVFVIVTAVGTLNIPAVTGFVTLVLSYLPNVIAALLIFLVAAAIAAAVGGLVHRTMGETPTGRVVRSAAPTLVMAIAVFMILNQLGIAQTIVTATYIALIGAVALGSALAFGLGGRDAAADLINSGYRKAQQQSDQVQRDLQVGRERAQAEAQQYTQQYGPNGGQGGQTVQPGAYQAGPADVPPTAQYGQVGDPYAQPADPYAQPGGVPGTPGAAGGPARPGDPYHGTEPVSPTPPQGNPRR